MTVDLDKLDRESRVAVNEDPDGSMTLPTQTVREVVARLQVAEAGQRSSESLTQIASQRDRYRAIVRDLAASDPHDMVEPCFSCGVLPGEPHDVDCLHRRAVEAKP